ncbi:MAG: (Fe-S)-binding protein [Candidatus Nanoarchaeia archaeon]|nr:(Fe-S)-binding protein [Candidatus Nanoarchaeia archaeon]
MGLFSVFKKSSTIYFPGCLTYFKFKDNFELYKKIFEKLGIEFRTVEKNICCGLPALEAGYENEARKLAKRNYEIFKEEQITSIIASSPCCYKMFLSDYPKILPDWNIDVKSIWKIILYKLELNPGLIRNKANESIVYNDSCYLGRYCGMYEEPRKILKLLGYELKEFFNSKEESFCCGSCGGLNRTNPEAANEIAKEKIIQARRINAKKIITSSLNDYEILKKNLPGSGIEIMDFSEVLAKALGIGVKKIVNLETLDNNQFNANSAINGVENKIKELKMEGEK